MNLILNLFIFFALFISASRGDQQENDYSQMFMVCSPVYSRSELQKILEQSINSLAFQIPVNPLQKLKKDFLNIPLSTSTPSTLLNSKSNNNNLNIQIVPKSDLKVQNDQYNREIESKLTTIKQTEELPTTYSPLTSTSTTTESSTVQPISSTVTSSKSTRSSSTTSTTASSTTTSTSTTTPVPTTTSSTTSIPLTTITGRPLRALNRPTQKRFYSSYHKQNNQQQPNTASSISPTLLPSTELNTKPSMAKIRSRLFNLFQPRQYNSNILHHQKRPVDYPTLSPQSLFGNPQNNNHLNTNSIAQQQTTTTTTVKPTTIESKQIYSSTESYPQIQSSISPELIVKEQSNQQITTSSSIDSLLKAKEEKQKITAQQFDNLNGNSVDKSKQMQQANDNLLAVASSSRFHSVLNSNEEKMSTKSEKIEEKRTDKLSNIDQSSKESSNEKTKDGKIDKSQISIKQEETSPRFEIGPLKLDEIFDVEIDETSKNDTNLEKSNDQKHELITEKSIDENRNEAQADKENSKVISRNMNEEMNKDQSFQGRIIYDDKSVNGSVDQIMYTDSPTESTVIDENDGIIVKKLSDVIDSVNDDKNFEIDDKSIEIVNQPDESTKMNAQNDQSNNKISLTSRANEQDKSSVKSENDIKNSDQDKNTGDDKKSNANKSNEFIEIPTMAHVPTVKSIASSDKFEEVKSSNDKSMNDKLKNDNQANDKSIENKSTEKLTDDKPINDKADDRTIKEKLNDAKLVEDDFETTAITSKPMSDDSSDSNKYTYPIEYLF